MTDWLLRTPLAHRGLHDAAQRIPENTLAAFAAAADAGVPVELDVHLTADGQPAVIHDLDLARVADRPDPVSQLTAAQLAAVRVAGTDQHVPTLDDVLALVAGRVGIMVELKNYGRTVGSLERAVERRLRDYRGPVCVASFNPRTVGWFARNAPDIARGQAASSFQDVEMPAAVRAALRRMLANRWVRPDFLSYDLRDLPTPVVDTWRRRGLPVVTWTVRTEADLAKARTVADNFIYEHVAP